MSYTLQDQQGLSPHAHTGYPPPAYENNRNSFAISDISSNDYEYDPKNTTYKIPPKLIYDAAWVSTTSYLGTSKDQRLFAVETPSRLINCFGLGKIILRDGTDKLSTPLASVATEKGSKLRRSLIRVAPKPGAANQGYLEVSMSGDWSSKHEFEMPIGDGTLERFEWRSSRGEQVREVSGGFNFGWKLVRLDGPPAQPGSGKNYTSEGQEVVAVGAHPRLFHKRPQFSLLGSGARGELGETFEIVALMGFLRLYELSMQQSAINGNAAAAASTSAAVA
ncbi:hypothetical protein S7711_10224 [Stachybotrys chartarum IBT 7711]|uniref:Phospholipid scramblase n=1 Tax=Stachybotrys chartarum (strain CBS 109288 / IBT 7711) TaxID=1280523 RepID=A0A084B549_STACB|nr:hypothetical protein S7711_10224 [Stachybotrys chartarum IBT 7711]